VTPTSRQHCSQLQQYRCRAPLIQDQIQRKERGAEYCTLATSYGESRWVCSRDRQTDGRTPDRYITLAAGRG